jgi:hypothetical protein
MSWFFFSIYRSSWCFTNLNDLSCKKVSGVSGLRCDLIYCATVFCACLYRGRVADSLLWYPDNAQICQWLLSAIIFTWPTLWRISVQLYITVAFNDMTNGNSCFVLSYVFIGVNRYLFGFAFVKILRQIRSTKANKRRSFYLIQKFY